MSENEIRVLYVQPGKYPEERIIPNTLSASQKLVGGNIESSWRSPLSTTPNPRMPPAAVISFGMIPQCC